MPVKPMPAFFLVRIEKKVQKERREKIGSLYVAPGYTFMTRNLQSGEIIAIGEKAHKEFPEANIGDTLLMHHFVEAQDDEKQYLVDEDDTYRYYTVTALSWNGRANETYGVWNGEKIITHQEFILLEKEKYIPPPTPDEYLAQALQETESGLAIFKDWKNTREETESKMASIKSEIESLSKSGTHKPHIQQGIAEKEMELNALSEKINKKTYLPYTIAALNPCLSEWFHTEIKEGDVIYMMNYACNTEIEFNGIAYLIASTRFIGFILNTKQG